MYKLKYVLDDGTEGVVPVGWFISEISSGEVPSNIVSAEIVDCVNTLSDNCFSGRTSLSSVTIPNSVQTLGINCFKGCTSLTGITIPNSVTFIGNNIGVNISCFQGCTSLSSVTFSDSMTKIGGSCFKGCTSLTGITIPNGVTSLGESCFQDCTSLTRITIPNSVTSLEGYCFSGCTGLASITIEATAPPTLGSGAFDNTNDCPIYVPCGSLNVYKTLWSVYADRLAELDDDCPSGSTNVRTSKYYKMQRYVSYDGGKKWEPLEEYKRGELYEEDCVECGGAGPAMDLKLRYETQVGNTIEVECDGSTTVDGSGISSYEPVNLEIGSCVRSIADYGFRSSHNLESVTIYDGVTHIGKYAFGYCGSLSSVTIPNSVTYIGAAAFYNCPITNIVLGDKIEYIGEDVFNAYDSATTYVKTFTINTMSPPILGGDIFRRNVPIIYVPCGTADKYKIANIWQKYANCIVERDGCGGCNTSGNTGDFYARGSWSDGSMTHFDRLSNSDGEPRLQTVMVGNLATRIYDCPAGETFQCLDFTNCDNLTTVKIACTVETIGSGSFYHCDSLRDIGLNEGLKEIGQLAFGTCPSLTSITIPNTVEIIGEQAFLSDHNLVEVTIGSGVTSIGIEAFNYCESLTSFTIKAENPPTIGSYAFSRTPDSMVIYVPPQSVDAYKAADGWSDYSSQIQPIQ